MAIKYKRLAANTGQTHLARAVADSSAAKD
jgi:hypothetical protein